MNQEQEKFENELKVVSVRLIRDAPILSEKPICSSQDAVNVLAEHLRDYDREVMGCIFLKASGVPISCAMCSIGALNYSVAHPREILKAAILSNAYSMILIHNHPSGSLTPSQADIATTEKMIKVCHLIGIPLLDHIIVSPTQDGHYSFAEKGIMPEYKNEKVPTLKDIEFSGPPVNQRKTKCRR